MGTRNLTMVIVDGETKVAQYGQWDGYPSGQGLTALTFLRNTDLEKFKEKLKSAKFIDDEIQKDIDNFLVSIGCNGEYLNLEQSEKYYAKYPSLNRNHGANILNLIMENEGDVILRDDSDFAADSLFCEWGYVIDFDKGTFEVYKGFQKKPLTKTQRFSGLNQEDNEYYPICMIKKYKLDNLPTEENFLNDFKNK